MGQHFGLIAPNVAHIEGIAGPVALGISNWDIAFVAWRAMSSPAIARRLSPKSILVFTSMIVERLTLAYSVEAPELSSRHHAT